jgi:hypothetical protein
VLRGLNNTVVRSWCDTSALPLGMCAFVCARASVKCSDVQHVLVCVRMSVFAGVCLRARTRAQVMVRVAGVDAIARTLDLPECAVSSLDLEGNDLSLLGDRHTHVTANAAAAAFICGSSDPVFGDDAADNGFDRDALDEFGCSDRSALLDLLSRRGFPCRLRQAAPFLPSTLQGSAQRSTAQHCIAPHRAGEVAAVSRQSADAGVCRMPPYRSRASAFGRAGSASTRLYRCAMRSSKVCLGVQSPCANCCRCAQCCACA